MTAQQQQQVAFREACFHLSNLLGGERCGERLGAEVIALTTEHRTVDREFLAQLVSDEVRHATALERYLRDKVDLLYEPDPLLVRAFDAVAEAPWPEIKLLAGQAVFEWTAASLISTLFVRANEPLVKKILQLNLRDEARHLEYSRLVSEPLRRLVGARSTTDQTDDVLFLAIAGSLGALFATPVWEEAGIPTQDARAQVFSKLEASGVITRYQTLLLRQIARCGYPIEGLEKKLASYLKTYLIDRR